MAVTADSLIAFLRQSAISDLGDIDSSTPLFSSRLVDSYAMVELMAFIEKQSGFRVAPFEVSLENFDTIESILRFVEKRNPTAVVR